MHSRSMVCCRSQGTGRHSLLVRRAPGKYKTSLIIVLPESTFHTTALEVVPVTVGADGKRF